MKRRHFLNRATAGITIPALLQGFSVKAFGREAGMLELFGLAEDTDHVLVLVQLNGGNDGLNTVIPIDKYSAYNNARNNIAIPESKVLPLAGIRDAGLHPAMTGMQRLYQEGMLHIVHSVGYPSPNFSHFRATDIWMSASDSNAVVSNGWAGRYLDHQYPGFPVNYPNTKMPDPLAIQIGSVTSLTMQGPAVTMGMSISNPTGFYNLVNNIQEPVPDTPAGRQLGYIRTVARQTQVYATAIKAAADKVAQQGSYPSTSLAEQLKIVARLIKGGLKTRVYMVSMTGFDNHANQVNGTDTTTGTHANLLKTLSDAIKAFQDDLDGLGVADRVVGMTFSEFGRRIKSNGSTGTDHGAAAPLFVFGRQVAGGTSGTTPLLPINAATSDNIAFQYDFRSVYATLLQDWFCLDKTTVQALLMKQFQSLPLLKVKGCVLVPPPTPDQKPLRNYPNPFENQTTIEFVAPAGHVLLQVIDMTGRVVAQLLDREYATATLERIPFKAGNMPAGSYYARLQTGSSTQMCLMLKVR